MIPLPLIVAPNVFDVSDFTLVCRYKRRTELIVDVKVPFVSFAVCDSIVLGNLKIGGKRGPMWSIESSVVFSLVTAELHSIYIEYIDILGKVNELDLDIPLPYPNNLNTDRHEEAEKEFSDCIYSFVVNALLTKLASAEIKLSKVKVHSAESSEREAVRKGIKRLRKAM